jgi:phosphoribosylglycinamide formyltransferase-1
MPGNTVLGKRAGPLPIAVLVSGEGTTLDALAELAANGSLPARIVLVLANRSGIGALEKAARRGLPSVVAVSREVPADAWCERVTAELESRGAELVVLAGFLKILPPSWIERWKGRVINIHPALLPRYGGPGMYGAHVHEAVLAAGDPETGATVHLVTEAVDGGPILAQQRIPVLPGDTPESLRARIHPVEVALLADTIRRFADGSLPLPYPERDALGSRRRDARGTAG